MLLKGFCVGLIFFVASFFFLYSSEKQIDFSDKALLWMMRLLGYTFMLYGLSSLFGFLIEISSTWSTINRNVAKALEFLISSFIASITTVATIFIFKFLNGIIAFIAIFVIIVDIIIVFFVILKNKTITIALTSLKSTIPQTNQLENYAGKLKTDDVNNNQPRHPIQD